MKTMLFGLAIALAVPAIAHAAETPADAAKAEKKCCCEEMKDGKMADHDMKDGHADHMDQEQKKN